MPKGRTQIAMSWLYWFDWFYWLNHKIQMSKFKVQMEKSWESGKTSSEREWSKKYVHGLLAGFPGGTLKNFG
jgi:hypothetical protein